MAGIYLHIPFCKRRCINALCRELEERKNYLEGEIK